MGGTDRLCEFQALVAEIDGDDCVRSDELGGHDRCGTDGARSEDGNRFARTYCQRIDDRTSPGLHPAPEGTEKFDGNVSRNFDDAAFIGQRVLGEAGLTVEMRRDGVAALVESDRTVQPHAVDVECLETHTVRGLALSAGLANTT